MEKFKHIIGNKLFWKQPSPKQLFFEMHMDEKVYCAMKFHKDHISQAIAKSSISEWEFKQEGVLKPKYIARALGSEEKFATYIPKFRKGILILNDDQEYLWQTTNPWQTRWTLFDQEQNPLINFAEDNENLKLWDIYKIEWIVDVVSPEIELEQLSFFIPFCFYILASKRKHSQQRQFLPILLKKEEELDF